MIDKREEIAKLDYEFGAPKSYFDWDKANDQDKSWHLRKADQILSLIVADDQTVELLSNLRTAEYEAITDKIHDYLYFLEDKEQFDKLFKKMVKWVDDGIKTQASKMIKDGWFKGK